MRFIGMLRNIYRYIIILIGIIPFNHHAKAGDSIFLKVHFLYGSRPAKPYKNSEEKWFGGIHGGHVGLEVDSSGILNFLPSGSFHFFPKKHSKHSHFAVHDAGGFYSIFGNESDSAQKAIVYIPITVAQKIIFDSLLSVYLIQTPYDYAALGMRCGSAAYEILGQMGIVKKFGFYRTCRKIFYPQKIRKRIFRKAKTNQWQILKTSGSGHRIWERD